MFKGTILIYLSSTITALLIRSHRIYPHDRHVVHPYDGNIIYSHVERVVQPHDEKIFYAHDGHKIYSHDEHVVHPHDERIVYSVDDHRAHPHTEKRETPMITNIHYHISPEKKTEQSSSSAPVQKKPEDDGCGGFSGKKVYIGADNGLLLARCYCAPGKNPNMVTVHGLRGNVFAQWTLTGINGKCYLKSDIGKYAARCHSCWKGGKYPDSVFNHVDSIGPAYAQWKVEKVGDKFAFKADTGKYMARCFLCLPGMAKDNAAMVHYTLPTGPALWSITTV